MSTLSRALVFCGLVALAGGPSPALAESFLFSASSFGGTGSALMKLSTGTTNSANDTIIVTLDNTSPLRTDNNWYTNSPAITGFGFDLLDPEPGTLSWSLTAYTKDSLGNLSDNPVVIGGTVGAPSPNPWILELDEGTGRLNFDYYPNTSPGSTVKGGIYNPLQTTGFGSSPLYFSQAKLEIVFSVPPLPVFDFDTSPFVRMQNVGKYGEGSLKIFGDEVDEPNPGPGTVPEPSSFVLLGLGSIGLVGYGWRRRQRKATRKVC